ncbi:MAG: hypothetical protein ACO1SV_15300 [Fimbriimonas sp.]
MGERNSGFTDAPVSQVRYTLEIYVPDGSDTVFALFQASVPFGAISRGDIINPGTWHDSNSPMRVLRVTSVEHNLWSTATDVVHKICVYTREIENTRESRFED